MSKIFTHSLKLVVARQAQNCPLEKCVIVLIAFENRRPDGLDSRPYYVDHHPRIRIQARSIFVAAQLYIKPSNIFYYTHLILSKAIIIIKNPEFTKQPKSTNLKRRIHITTVSNIYKSNMLSFCLATDLLAPGQFGQIFGPTEVRFSQF